MMYLDYFETVSNHSDYNTANGKLDWKRIGDILYWQESEGLEDWIKNFLFLPIPIRLGRLWVWLPLGSALDIHAMRKILKKNPDIKLVVGYSRGGWAS